MRNLNLFTGLKSVIYYTNDSTNEIAPVTNMTNQLMSIMTTIFQYVGIILIVWGIIQFILSVKRIDAESKSDALMVLMCGIGLASIKFLVIRLQFFYGGVTM